MIIIDKLKVHVPLTGVITSMWQMILMMKTWTKTEQSTNQPTTSTGTQVPQDT